MREPSGPDQEMNAAPADGARLDFSGAMSYGDYLALDQVLGAQHPRSGDHNEMLFIVQHTRASCG